MADKKLSESEDKTLIFRLNDAEYKTTSNKMYEARKPHKPHNPNQLHSFMPGNIPDVMVKEGDEVKEGDMLLILEAMKMKNQIRAPYNGRVKIINVKVGDQVSKHHLLVELEPIEE